MANILVRDVPDEIHAALRDQAARHHQSLQQYLVGELTRLGRHRSVADIFDEIDALDGGRVGFTTARGDLAGERSRR